MGEVNNNTKLLNTIEEDFFKLISDFNNKNNFLNASKEKYITKESEKLSASKVIFKEQMVKNNAYAKAVKDLSEIWGKGEKVLTSEEIKELLTKNLKEAFKNTDFIEKLDD